MGKKKSNKKNNKKNGNKKDNKKDNKKKGNKKDSKVIVETKDKVSDIKKENTKPKKVIVEDGEERDERVEDVRKRESENDKSKRLVLKVKENTNTQEKKENTKPKKVIVEDGEERDERAEDILKRESENAIVNKKDGDSKSKGLVSKVKDNAFGLVTKNFASFDDLENTIGFLSEVDVANSSFGDAFGDMANEANMFVDDFQSLTGTTNVEAKSIATSLQDSFTSDSISSEDSTDFTNQSMELIGALSNQNYGSETPESVMEKFQSAFDGDLSGLAELDISIDESTLEGLSEFERVQTILSEIESQSGDALAGYNEESLSMQQNLDIIKAGFTDALGGIGSTLIPIINLLLNLAKDVMPVVTTAFEWLGDKISSFFTGAESSGNSFAILKEAIENSMSDIVSIFEWAGNFIGFIFEGIIKFIAFLIDNLKLVIPVVMLIIGAFAIYKTMVLISSIATKLATLAQLGLNLAMLASPITWIVLIIMLIIGVIIYLAHTLGGLGNVFDLVVSYIYTGLLTLAKLFLKAGEFIIKTIIKLFYAGFETVQTVVNAIIDLINTIFGTDIPTVTIATDMKNKALDFIEDTVGIGVKFFDNKLDEEIANREEIFNNAKPEEDSGDFLSNVVSNDGMNGFISNDGVIVNDSEYYDTSKAIKLGSNTEDYDNSYDEYIVDSGESIASIGNNESYTNMSSFGSNNSMNYSQNLIDIQEVLNSILDCVKLFDIKDYVSNIVEKLREQLLIISEKSTENSENFNATKDEIKTLNENLLREPRMINNYYNYDYKFYVTNNNKFDRTHNSDEVVHTLVAGILESKARSIEGVY